MNDHKVYCDECNFLEERPVKAEVPMGSGNYIVTGKRFYCARHDKFFALNTPFELMKFNYCIYGDKKLK